MGSITHEVTLNFQPPPKAKVRGKVRYYSGNKSVAGVSLNAEGGTSGSANSAGDGTFELNLDAGNNNNYTLRPSKSGTDSSSSTVTTSDITFIRRHILLIQDLDSPHAVLAADVNDSGSVTTSDITFIRRVILAIDSALPGATWKFVRADQAFPELRNPWSHDKTRSIANLASDMENLDFIAMRAGDVNGSWSAAATAGAPGQSSGSSRASLMGMPPHNSAPVRLRLAGEGSGSLAKVRLKASGFQKVTSLQFTLQWDPAVLQYVGVTELGLAGLSPGNFGTTRTAQGHLLFSWDDPSGTGITLNEGATLYALELNRAGAGAMSAVRFTDNPTLREVTVDGRMGALVTEDGTAEATTANTVLEIVVTTGRAGRRVSVSFVTVAGKSYALEATESLNPASWKQLNQVAGDGAAKVLMDESPRDPQRFYRVRVQ